MGGRKRIIDRFELRRLRQERDLAQTAFKLLGGVCSKRTYLEIEKEGVGTDKMLHAIAKAMALPHGIDDFLPVRISQARLQDHRRRRGWTPAELAKRCGLQAPAPGAGGIPWEPITAELIRRIEAGDVPDAGAVAGSHELCRRLAAALGCRFNDLVDDPSAAAPRRIAAELLGPLSEEWVERLFKVQDPKTGGIRTGCAGGCTQPWSTAQVLVGALHVPEAAKHHSERIRRAFAYLAAWRHPLGRPAGSVPAEQNQGWALYEAEDAPVTEITCWVLAAYAHALQAGTVWPAEQDRIRGYLAREIGPLLHRQYSSPERCPAGGFCPTGEVRERNQRTYSSVMAVWALLEVLPLVRDELTPAVLEQATEAIRSGISWLLRTRHREFGWIPSPGGGNPAHHLGLTAQVLFVLTVLAQAPLGIRLPLGYAPAIDDFVAHGRRFFPGWEFGDLAGNRGINLGDVVLEGTSYRLEPSLFFWAPWSLALLSLVTRTGSPGKRAADLVSLRDRAAAVIHRAFSHPEWGSGTSEIGEALFGVSWLRGADGVSAGGK